MVEYKYAYKSENMVPLHMVMTCSTSVHDNEHHALKHQSREREQHVATVSAHHELME
jgi:hypothetical protein